MPRSTRGKGRRIATRDEATGGLARRQSDRAKNEQQQRCTHGAACHFKLKCTRQHTDEEISVFTREAELLLELAEIRTRRKLEQILHAQVELRGKQPTDTSEKPPEREVAPQRRAPVHHTQSISQAPGTRNSEGRDQTESKTEAPEDMNTAVFWKELYRETADPSKRTANVEGMNVTPERAARVAAALRTAKETGVQAFDRRGCLIRW